MPVQQPASNAQGHARDIRDPVVDFGAPVEAGLDEFDRAAEGTRADEDGEQSDAAGAGQREGECGEGDEVHQFVAALRRWGRFQGPEHGDGQGERHGEGQGYVEVLAHAIGLTAPGAERKWKLSPGVFAVKVKLTEDQGLKGSDKRVFRAYDPPRRLAV